MLIPGLVSITFRQLSPREIAALVVRGHLKEIEWGGDIHVPVGNLAAAREVQKITSDHGLSTAAYGSYFRIIENDGSMPEFASTLETALELGAPTIRVWAGCKNSEDSSADDFNKLAYRLHEIAETASVENVRIALEFHGETYTNTTVSTLELLKRVSHANLDTLWQPPVGMDAADCAFSLQDCLPHVSNIHVFHWFPNYERHPLRAGFDRWQTYIEILRSTQKDYRLLIEFVAGDTPEQFLEDAAVIQEFIIVSR